MAIVGGIVSRIELKWNSMEFRQIDGTEVLITFLYQDHIRITGQPLSYSHYNLLDSGWIVIYILLTTAIEAILKFQESGYFPAKQFNSGSLLTVKIEVDHFWVPK